MAVVNWIDNEGNEYFPSEAAMGTLLLFSIGDTQSNSTKKIMDGSLAPTLNASVYFEYSASLSLH